MSRHHVLLLALGIISAFALGPSPAEAQNDFHALYNRFRFHQLSLSPRSAAMGGAYSALQDEDNTLVGNPASLGFLEHPFVNAGYDFEDVASDLTLINPNAPEEGEAEMWTASIGGAYPLEWGAVGLQYAFRQDDLDSEEAPSIAGFNKQDGDLDRNMVGLGVGYRLMDNVAIGYRFNYFDWDLDRDIKVTRPAPFTFASLDEEFQGHRHQFGVQYGYSEALTMGLDGYFALGDRDSSVLGDADADSYSIRGGVAWTPHEECPVLIALDLNYDLRDLDGGGNDAEEELFGLHLGLEYEVMENLYLRAGYQVESIDFDDTPAGINESLDIYSITTGVGYKWEHISFDYAFMYTDTGSGDTAHFFGIGYEF